MSIKDLQLRFAQVGVIRLGEQRTGKNGKPYPAKLTTFRVTSPSRVLVDGVAKLYGGQVKPWQSNTGPQWEVITEVKEIPVFVPPQLIDPNYELWGNGFRSRLCDGETERVRNVPCMCLAQFGEGFTQTAPPGQACKPTTRLSLMLADAAGLGTFKLESHGWNAAAELPMLASAIVNAPQPIPARLEIQARQKKILRPDQPQDKQIETRNYLVPVLHFDFVNPSQAFSGQIGAAAQAALGGGEQRQALEAGPAAPDAESGQPKLTEERVLKLADDLGTIEALQELWRAAAADRVLTDAVKRVLTQRSEDIQKGAKAQEGDAPTDGAAIPAVASQGPASSPADDAEVADVEPDRDQVWGDIMRAAKPLGWNLTVVEEKYRGRMGHDPNEEELATGWKYEEFLAAVKAGEVR